MVTPAYGHMGIGYSDVRPADPRIEDE